MMTSHVKLRKEKGSLAEYESQMKGEQSLCCGSVSVHTRTCVRLTLH